MAYTKLGKYEKAEEMFLKTLELDDTAIDLYLELGRIYFILDRCEEADNVLSKFRTLSDDIESKSYAARLAEGCEEEEIAEKSPYTLSITIGSQYDDNLLRI